MSDNKFQQNISVLVTSQATQSSGLVADEKIAWLNLHDYIDCETFLNSAKQTVAKLTNEENPILYFISHKSGARIEDLIEGNYIDPTIWELMAHDTDTANILWGYRQCYAETADMTIEQQIEEATAAFIGHFDSASELVNDWLIRNETACEVIDVITQNLDVTAVADEISSKLRFADGYYFH